MEHFYVSKFPRPNGDHDIHRGHCKDLPQPEARIDLGLQSDSFNAYFEAKKYYNQVNGCPHCAVECFIT